MGATNVLSIVPIRCGPFVPHSRPYSQFFWVFFKHFFASQTHGEGAVVAAAAAHRGARGCSAARPRQRVVGVRNRPVRRPVSRRRGPRHTPS